YSLTLHRINISCECCLRSSRQSPRCLAQAEILRAFVTQPNNDLRRIRPEKRRHFTRHLHRIINTQSLQGLQVEHPVVEITVSSLLTVNTLPLKKHLPLHLMFTITRLHRAEIRSVIKCRVYKVVSFKSG